MRKRIDPLTLLQEKRLVHIWRIYACLPPSKFNFRVSLSVLVLILVFADDSLGYSKSIIAVADLGITVSVSILGFLIAGYTILASTANLEMMQRMAESVDSETKMSVLQRDLYSMVTVFIEYLFLAFCSLMIRLLSLDVLNFTLISTHVQQLHNCCCRILLAFMCGLIIFALLELKSCIFNVNHFVMTTVAWSLADRYRSEDIAKIDAAAVESENSDDGDNRQSVS